MIVDAWDEDISVRFDEGVHQENEIRHRFMDRSSKDARMKIFCGSLDRDFEVADSSQTILPLAESIV